MRASLWKRAWLSREQIGAQQAKETKMMYALLEKNQNVNEAIMEVSPNIPIVSIVVGATDAAALISPSHGLSFSGCRVSGGGFSSLGLGSGS